MLEKDWALQMKIGILTFHSQTNYGGVLQCWALQTALERMGHDVVVIDRWGQGGRKRHWGENLGFKGWVKLLTRTLLGLGDLNYLIRVKKTLQFIKARLKLTPYHFWQWKDAPKNLGVDMIVVGSDQVWRFGGGSDAHVYLLEDAPVTSAISYAASFGMRDLPCGDAVESLYRKGLARFKGISCREREGVDICRKLGFEAVHVVDPVLLAWGDGADIRSQEKKERIVLAYFLSENPADYLDVLAKFSRGNSCKVKVYISGAWSWAFNSVSDCAKMSLKVMMMRIGSHVEIMTRSGPEEFLRAFRTAKWVVSDSFHALMFSIVYGCNVRIIRPSSKSRRQMFARIEEFECHAKGQLIVNSVSDALASFANGESVLCDYEWLEKRRRESETWLAQALK